MPTSKTSLRVRPLKLLGVLALTSVAYLVAANLALRSLLRELDQTALEVRWVHAYTLMPGTVTMTQLRVSERASQQWMLTAGRVELELAVLDLLLQRRHVKLIRIMDATLVVGQAAARLSGDDSPTLRSSVFHAGLMPSAPEPRGAIRVDRLIASFSTIGFGGDLLSGSLALNAQGLSLSADALSVGGAAARLRGVAFRRGRSDWATALRAEVRAKRCRLPLGPAGHADGRIEIDGESLPTGPSGLLTSQPVTFKGQLVFVQGRLARGSDVTLQTEAPATLDPIGGAFLKAGFVARLVVSEDGTQQGSLLAPVLLASDSVEPSFELRDASLHLDPSRAIQVAVGLTDEVQARLDVRQCVLRIGPQLLASPMQANVMLKRAAIGAQALALGGGTVTLLGVVTEPPTLLMAPMSASIHFRSGVVLPPGPLHLAADFALSGAQLRSLLQIADAPEPARWMLSRFRHAPFELRALIDWTPDELRLREVRLDSGRLRIEGMLHQAGTARRGAFLLSVGREALGIHFEGSRSSVEWGADQTWLEAQGKQLTQP